MSDRITINAGGRRFETSTTTLVGCGAGYFEALLGETGQKLRGRKRARAPEVTGSADDDAPGEIFVDRSPDLFEDILQFARANRLSAATRKDAERLEDLKTEAEFFCYDRLAAACDEALEALERARPAARCLTFHVKPYFTTSDEGDEIFRENVVKVDVPKDHVFYIVSAQPCLKQGGSNNGMYNLAATNELHDADGVVSIVIGSEGTPNRPGAGFTMGGGAAQKIHLYGYGAKFLLIAWVGHPSKIPGLGAPRD